MTRHRLNHIAALTMVWALGGCRDAEDALVDPEQAGQGNAGSTATGGSPATGEAVPGAGGTGTGGAASVPALPPNPEAQTGDTPAVPLEPETGSDAGTNGEEPAPTDPAASSPFDAGAAVVDPPSVVEEPEPDPPPVVEEPEPDPPPVVEEPEPDPPPVVEEPEPDPPPEVEEPEPDPPPVVEEPEPPPVIPPSFEADVWPIFMANCSTCHTTLRRGGHSVGSPVLATADADARRLGGTLIERLDGGGMPPNCSGSPGDLGCISVADLALIELWIDTGMAP